MPIVQHPKLAKAWRDRVRSLEAAEVHKEAHRGLGLDVIGPWLTAAIHLSKAEHDYLDAKAEREWIKAVINVHGPEIHMTWSSGLFGDHKVCTLSNGEIYGFVVPLDS